MAMMETMLLMKEEVRIWARVDRAAAAVSARVGFGSHLAHRQQERWHNGGRDGMRVGGMYARSRYSLAGIRGRPDCRSDRPHTTHVRNCGRTGCGAPRPARGVRPGKPSGPAWIGDKRRGR